MDITPLVQSHTKIIQGYGDQGFEISGQSYKTAVYITPVEVINVPFNNVEELTADFLDEILSPDALDLILIGSGQKRQPLAPELTRYFVNHNIGLECMDTGAACRTYNVLIAEGRRMGAILFPH